MPGQISLSLPGSIVPSVVREQAAIVRALADEVERLGPCHPCAYAVREQYQEERVRLQRLRVEATSKAASTRKRADEFAIPSPTDSGR